MIEALRWAKARIDGAHRARLARLASGGATVDRLERPGVQQLIRVARADPRNWTERTPGDGALGQIHWFAGLIGAVASCAVLARLRVVARARAARARRRQPLPRQQSA